MSHYAELGVGKTADKDEIKRAFRKKAQKSHPDKGGDKDKFYAIQKAYDVLSDDARRARYDLGGDDEPTPDLESLALAQIGNLFLQIIEKGDIEHINVVEEMRGNVKAQDGKDKSDIAILRKTIVKREKAIKRVKHKGKGPNMLEQMLLADIAGRKRQIAGLEEKMALYAKMLVLLNDYEYKADPMTQNQAFATVFQTFGARRY